MLVNICSSTVDQLALGFCLSWDKCRIMPTQQGRFLGLLVDSASYQLIIPPDKVEYIKELITSALRFTLITRRQIPNIAGV